MIKTRTIFALLLLTATADSSFGEVFVRPVISYVKSTTDGLDSEVGFGVVGGSVFGAKKEHELSVQIDSVKWTFSGTYNQVTVSAYEKYLPILLNYRYHVKGEQELKNVDFYVGPSVGAARLEVGYNSNVTGFNESSSTWSFTWGGSAGFVVNLAKNVDLDVGYRYVLVDGGTFHAKTLNTTIGIEDARAHVFYSGLGFRF